MKCLCRRLQNRFLHLRRFTVRSLICTLICSLCFRLFFYRSVSIVNKLGCGKSSFSSVAVASVNPDAPHKTPGVIAALEWTAPDSMVSLGPPRLDMPLPNRRESKQGSGGAADSGSTASATGNPRNKVALAPGRSLLDWVRLGKGNVDLSGTGGHRRDVTAEELAKHCTAKDAWTALKGL